MAKKEEKPEKFEMTHVDALHLERAAQLKIIDEFERRLIVNITERYRQYGYKTKITHKQREQLRRLSSRFEYVFGLSR